MFSLSANVLHGEVLAPSIREFVALLINKLQRAQERQLICSTLPPMLAELLDVVLVRIPASCWIESEPTHPRSLDRSSAPPSHRAALLQALQLLRSQLQASHTPPLE